jgi:hypothetical protein
MLEDTHRQVIIDGKDYDLILRTNDEQTEFVAVDIFDHSAQTIIQTVKI